MSFSYLFDIGNVILFFDFGKAAARIQPRSPFSIEEILEKVSPLTPALESGKITPDEFLDSASEKIQFDGDRATLREAFEDIFEVNQPVVDWIGELDDAGIPLFLLSNTNGIHVPFFEATYPVFSRFQGRIYSHEAGVMKPDPEIFRITIETLELNPEKTIYIDDLAGNCAAGGDAGLHSFCYHPDRHAAIREQVKATIS